MNINATSNKTNFTSVFVNTNNMGRKAHHCAKNLEKILNSSKEIQKLDNMGVDVYLCSDRAHKSDSVNVCFVDSWNGDVFLVDDKKYVNVKYYSPNPQYKSAQRILNFAQHIIHGTADKEII